MCSKLKEHFGDRLVITHINGKSNIVTFRNTAAAILQDFYNSQQKPALSSEKIRLVQTASKLIMSDIKLVETENNCHPSYDDFQSQDKCISFLPETIRKLLEVLIVGKGAKMKIASIGQAIMQAARPRVLLAPLQFGLGVQMHHHFGSRLMHYIAMDFVELIMKCNNLKGMQRYLTTQTFLITRQSLCSMQQTMWTTTVELLMATRHFTAWG